MKKALLPALLASLLIQNGSVLASSSATATVDWSSLNVQLVDQSGGLDSPVFTWTSGQTSLSSTAETHPTESISDDEWSGDFNTLLTSNANTSRAQASAVKNDDVISVVASSESGTVPLAFGEGTNNASSSAYFGPIFSLQGKGIAIITLNWSLSVTGTPGDWSDFADAYISISGLFNDNIFTEVTAHSGYSTYSSYLGDASYSGTFIMAMSNAGGLHYGSISAAMGAYAYSPSVPVPEPETYAMLLAGLSLLCLTVQRRKI